MDMTLPRSTFRSPESRRRPRATIPSSRARSAVVALLAVEVLVLETRERNACQSRGLPYVIEHIQQDIRDPGFDLGLRESPGIELQSHQERGFLEPVAQVKRDLTCAARAFPFGEGAHDGPSRGPLTAPLNTRRYL